jgi:hypothetical protein
MVLLSLLPQFHLWLARRGDWNGAYVSPQGDEPLYSAYVNALINGRTRKNDPFGGRDNSVDSPLPESIFSIQSLPAYAIAIPARMFGATASTSFIVLVAAAALLASLSVYSLLSAVTDDSYLAAAGTLFVLCFGCVVGKHGIFGTFLDVGPAAFPFLRRYQPAAVFPLFFLFQLFIWRSLNARSQTAVLISAILGSLTLLVLIFSHLYLWTASTAWLGCIAALWLYSRPAARWNTGVVLATVTTVVAIGLVPYVYLLSHRASTLDEQQIMISTHNPDLFRVPEVLGAVILLMLGIGIRRRRIELSNERVLYVASLAFLPFVVFNQQVITGKSMQAFHFEVAVVNYSTLVGVLLTLALFWKPIPGRCLIWIASVSIVWGIITVGLPARLIFVPQAIANDQAVPVLLRLKELSKEDGTLSNLRSKGNASTWVFSPSVALIALLPTWTSQGTLLDITGVDCLGLTREERKRLFYMHLYYSGTDPETLRRALLGTIDQPSSELSGVRTAVFGYDRTSPALTSQFTPIKEDEVEREVQAYRSYTIDFSRQEAISRPLTYAVVPAEGDSSLVNLDRWYERDEGEPIGGYILYRLKLRD